MRGLSITRGWVQDPQCFPAIERVAPVRRLREEETMHPRPPQRRWREAGLHDKVVIREARLLRH